MRRRIIVARTLRSDCVDAYRALHGQVWPELEVLYRACGFCELSCFLHGETLLVYLDLEELVHREKEAWLGEHPVERKWQQHIQPLLTDAAPVIYEEIYHLPAATTGD